jgi:hypothetical protein
MDWQVQLITLYVFICKRFEDGLNRYCERMTHHADLSFTDEAVVTIFMFGIMSKHKELKDIYRQANDYWRDGFPKLPSYVAIIQRLNRSSDVFIPLIEALGAKLPVEFQMNLIRVMDSMPIAMAQGCRRFKAKVAPELACPNGYCAAKKLHYYGVKLHVVGVWQKGTLPLPEYVSLTPAGMHDRKAYEQILPMLSDYDVFADKAYQREGRSILHEGSVILCTPVKKQKGQTVLDSAERLLSSAVSSIRQPIESFFNWLEEKTKIQMASKVRSFNGLMVHVFGRMAAAFFMLVNKFSS